MTEGIKRDIGRAESYKIRGIDYNSKGLYIELEREDGRTFNLHGDSHNNIVNTQTKVEYYNRVWNANTITYDKILEGVGNFHGFFQSIVSESEAYPIAIVEKEGGELVILDPELIKFVRS